MKKRNLFETYEDSLKFFAKEANKGVPKQVMYLWDSIIEYSDSTANLSGQGNSGEFHDGKDERDCEAALKEAEKKLIDNFRKATSYQPAYIKIQKQIWIGTETSNREQWVEGTWQLTKAY